MQFLQLAHEDTTGSIPRACSLEYIGEFRYHDDYQADAPSVNGGDDDDNLRKVIVFRLKQLDGADAGPLRARLDQLGRQAEPWPDELPTDSRCVPTYHHTRQTPATATRQLASCSPRNRSQMRSACAP
jgi:hypothetical protein